MRLSRLGRVPAVFIFLEIFSAVALASVFFSVGHNHPQSTLASNRALPSSSQPKISHSNYESAAYDSLPLIFEPNQGQTAPEVGYLAHGRGYGLYLTRNESVLVLRSRGSEQRVLRMKLAGAQPTAPAGFDSLPGKSNYFIGNDAAQWHRNIPQFARVRYRNVYPGTDLVYYGNHGEVEYDFEVSPGADPKRIDMQFEGAGNMHLEHGDLILTDAGKELRLRAPRSYQRNGKSEQPVRSRFKVLSNNEVALELGAYDPSRTLIIDPVLTYSTYLGGSADESCSIALGYTIPPASTAPVGSVQGTGCPAVAVDSAQNAYVAGTSDSTDFPSPTGTSPTLTGGFDVFIAKFNSGGSTLLFSTFIGGSSTDTTAGVAVDSGFNIILAGNTLSSNFPAAGGFQTAPLNANNHAFVSKLDPSGSVLLYSTYLSGNGTDTATGVALDPSGKGYVTGITTSTDQPSGTSAFPATIGALFTTSKYAGGQFFLSVLNFASTGFGSLIYSTYLGGSTLPSGGTPAIGGGIAVDSSYNAYLTGGTSFTDMPVLNAYQGTSGGGIDVWVAKMSFPQNSAQPPTLSYLTYLGGTGDDIGYGVAVDTGQNAYITGSTGSTDFNFTTTSGLTGFQTTYGGGASDAFVAKLGPLCTTTNCSVTTVPFNYFSYIGGPGTDIGLAITVDTAGGARVTGSTNTSSGFPVFNNGGLQSVFGGGAFDAFVARIDTTAATSTAPGHYVSYLGGGGTDIGTSIAVDLYGNSYVAGETSSVAPTPFPTLSAFQGTLNGPSDAFLSKVSPLVNLALTATASPSPVGIGNPVAFQYTITNNGDFLSGVTLTDTLPTTGATFSSASSTSGNCSGATSGNVSCSLGAISPSATSTVTINLTPTAGGSLGNSASISVPQTNFVTQTASASAVVSNFTLAVTPASATVQAGVPATFTAVVTPTGADPDSVSISCSSGLPTGSTCTVSNNPITNLNTGAQSRDVVITTTARVTTTTRFWRERGPMYAALLPVSGLSFFGFLIGNKSSRKRRWIVEMLLGIFVLGLLLQAGCSSTNTTTTTTGTPAGTYIVTITATSGAYSTPASTVTLTVQ